MTPRPARIPPRAAVVLRVHGLERAADAPGAPAGASPDNYPPCDLLRGPEPGGLQLVFAVVGFAPRQLEIFVTGDQFTVSGAGTGDGDPGRFLHRGIAARRFRRAFRLAPGLDVVGAEFDRGLLTVALASPAPDRAGGHAGDRASRGIPIHPVTRPGTT